jgi:hypothetical protein
MYCPVWGKFFIIRLHTVLLGAYGFHGIGRREGRTCLMGVIENALTGVP